MTNFFDRFFISSGKDFDKKYGTILASRSNVGINEGIIYTVTFTNIATGEEETLEIRNQKGKIKQSHLFYIYCNVGKENETMICKIKRYIKKLDMKYTIEVAPGVDYMYMFALCNIFIGIKGVYTHYLFNDNCLL